MKKTCLLALALIALSIIGTGCSLPTREEINEAKNARDGAERPVNERDVSDQ
jgi:hypothetical protein